MDRLSIEASYRADMSKSRTKQLRRDGYVTGSVFGRDSEPIPIELKLDDLINQVKQAEAGANSLIDMKIKGGPKNSDGVVLIKDYFKHPLTRRVLDIQFQRISLKDKINIGIPVELVGEAPGTREGGMLDQILYELQVHCLPTDIPPRIEIDVSNVQLGDTIKVADVKLEGDVELLDDPEAVVVSCREPHVVSVEAEVAAEEAEGAEAGAEGEAAAAEGHEEASGE